MRLPSQIIVVIFCADNDILLSFYVASVVIIKHLF